MRKLFHRLRGAAVCAGIMAVIYLFYKSLWVLTLLLPCIMIYRKIHRRDEDRKYREDLGFQFKDLLESLAASLRAGYSVENALPECLKELSLVHGEDSPVCRELKVMINQIRIGMSCENVLLGFGNRSGSEDIRTFASVFCIARRTGGDMVRIIRRTAEDIAEKADTKKEIAVLVSSRRLELRIITMIPALIIVYIDLTCEGLLDPLYGNPVGVLIMTVCLAVYAGAVLLGRKIMDIEV